MTRWRVVVRFELAGGGFRVRPYIVTAGCKLTAATLLARYLRRTAADRQQKHGEGSHSVMLAEAV